MSIDHGEWSSGKPGAGVERTIAFARHADEAGFDSIWLNEDPDGWDAFAVLGAIARETSQVRLGTGVTNIFHRNPNLMAASVSTIDQLSNGRAFLGIGRGQPEVYDQIFGLDVREPLLQMEQGIDLLRQWWADGATASGPGLGEGARWPRLIQPLSQPPIYIAAAGPRALALAGTVADGVLFNELSTPEFVRWVVSRVSEAAAKKGRDPQAMTYFVNPALMVTDNPSPILERKKTFVALVHALPGMERLLMSDRWDVPEIMAGVRKAMHTEEVIRKGGLFAELREVGDLEMARSLIPTGLIDEAAAIGPIDHVRTRLAQFAEAGATHIFVDRRGLPDDAAAVRALLDRLTSGELRTSL